MKIDNTSKQTIIRILTQKTNVSQWVTLFDNELSAHVRCGTRLWDGNRVQVFYISNLIFAPSVDERSIMKSLLDYLEPEVNIFIESIDLAPILILVTERGYDTKAGSNFIDIDAMYIKDTHFSWDSYVHEQSTDHNAAYKRAMKVVI